MITQSNEANTYYAAAIFGMLEIFDTCTMMNIINELIEYFSNHNRQDKCKELTQLKRLYEKV